jgi:hypothetical protein
MSMKSVSAALVVLSSVVAGTAHAIPNIRECSSYRTFGSGFITNQQIAYENSPHAVSQSSALISATGRCMSLWQSMGGTSLSFANAGVKAQVWLTGSGYNYACLRCTSLVGPVLYDAVPINAARALQLAKDAIREGEVVNVTRKFVIDGDKFLPYFEVDVSVDGHLAQVRVDGESGAVQLPEVRSAQEVVPENVCK